MKIAPKIKGERIPRHSGLHPSVAKEIEKLASKFKVSKSYVISSCLAEFFSIHEEGKYYE